MHFKPNVLLALVLGANELSTVEGVRTEPTSSQAAIQTRWASVAIATVGKIICLCATLKFVWTLWIYCVHSDDRINHIFTFSLYCKTYLIRACWDRTVPVT